MYWDLGSEKSKAFRRLCWVIVLFFIFLTLFKDKQIDNFGRFLVLLFVDLIFLGFSESFVSRLFQQEFLNKIFELFVVVFTRILYITSYNLFLKIFTTYVKFCYYIYFYYDPTVISFVFAAFSIIVIRVFMFLRYHLPHYDLEPIRHLSVKWSAVVFAILMLLVFFLWDSWYLVYL